MSELMGAVYRILDANANRAREALRVMEEAARFVLDDGELAEAVKSLRHELAAALGQVIEPVYWRDTGGDVGTAIEGSGESARAGVVEVVSAAGKRLSEALRALEEYGKTLPVENAGTHTFAARIEALRYHSYEVEQRLVGALGSGRARQWRLCVLITEAMCAGGDWLDVARACVAAGADCIQLREKELPAGELLARCRALVKVCRPAGVSVIVNDRPDVALVGGTDGVHLGQSDLPVAEARRLVGRQLVIGASTANLDQARAAQLAGADYCGVGPMFATTTVNDKQHLAGVEYLRAYLEWDKLPHLAIGGIGPGNVDELVAAGARGVAVCGCVCQADRPGEVVRQLLALFGDTADQGV